MKPSSTQSATWWAQRPRRWPEPYSAGPACISLAYTRPSLLVKPVTTILVKVSMSGKGDCWDAASIESLFSRLKEQLGDCFTSRAVARAELFQYIEVFYNRQRLHSSLDYTSPAEFESTWWAAADRPTIAVETDATVEIASRFPPPLGDRSAFSTSSHSTTATT